MATKLIGFVNRAAPALCPTLAALLLLVAGCGPKAPPAGPDMLVVGDPCTVNMHRCNGLKYQNCKDGVFTDLNTCDTACDDGLGCVNCTPKTAFCQGDDVINCDANGDPAGIRATCTQGGCVGGDCTDPCGKAAAEFSYLGCDYYPTVTVNTSLTASANFAIAIANPGDSSVNAEVTRNGMSVAKLVIDAGGLQTVKLPWVMELKEPNGGGFGGSTSSVLLTGGSYRLSTDGPVSAYQFNPLEFQVRPNCDPNNPSDMSCFTYTNDASLLLPASTLAKDYIVIARPTFSLQYDYGFGGQPTYVSQSGFFSVVATEVAPTNLTVRFSAPTQAGANGSVMAYKAGDTGTFMMKQGDVLQILSQQPMSCMTMGAKEAMTGQFNQKYTVGYCPNTGLDLTGTEITSNRRIAVYAGHDCTFVPYNKWACDHLEEAMLPLQSWGKDYLGAHAKRVPVTTPDYWRVVAGADATTITFDPPSVNQPVTLNKGEWVEFPSKTDFEATANNPFALVQYLVGENFYPSGGGNPGDPAMSLSVPVEQYRKSYLFLAPASYTLNFVNITAPVGTVVTLDGAPVDAKLFSPLGMGGKYIAARLDIAAGTHKISAPVPFGIQVYGLAPFTAYMYPGGLDVKDFTVQ